MSVHPVGLRIPPGPSGIQGLRGMRTDPLPFLAELARYGDITRHETDGETVYVINRPDAARYVLKDNNANYTKDATPDDAMLRPLLGNGLLTSSGEDWARQRKMCAPAFRRSEVETFDTIFTDAATQLTNQWAAAAAAGTAVRADHDLTALTLTVVMKAMLGADVVGAGVGDGFGRAVDAVNRFIGHYVPADDPDPDDTRRRRHGYVQAKALLDAVVRTIIASRRMSDREAAAHRDLLDALLGTDLDVTELRDQVLTIVMAGHETTAKSLSWTLYLLDAHPEALDRVYAEVDAVLGDRPPTAEDLPALEECRRAISEAMRLYPPVWLISRRAMGPDVVGGYDVPAGTLVCISPWVLHRHPDHWDEPLAYRPERFAPELSAERPSHLYLPFGGGARMCIGNQFAMVEAVLVLATVLQRLRLRLVPDFPVEPEALVTLRPRHGLMMVPSLR